VCPAPGKNRSMVPENHPNDAAVDPMVDRLDYPLFVVTAAAGGEMSGCLVGFATQCSIDPPRFLVCVSKENHTYPVALAAPGLAVHLLGADQVELARLFGELTGDTVDKFAAVAWRAGLTGAPVLADCAAYLEGPVRSRHDLGDHVGFIVEPAAGGSGGRSGELTLRRVGHLDAGHPA